jgi:hypothetical protein
MLLFGPLSLGDDLLCTAVLHEARRRGLPFAMMTSRPEFFAHNTDPLSIIPTNDYYARVLSRLGSRVVQPYYNRPDPTHPTRDLLPDGHIIAEMCRSADIDGTVALRPYLHLTAWEKAEGVVFPQQVVIHSTCLTAALPYPTKEWGVDRLAEVARRLSGHFKVVQIGAASDPALPVDQDLRGRTTLREAAAILSSAELFVGLEGFLTHLARSVDCPSVVIMGGRARPSTFGYACNVNLGSTVACAPCGLRDGCPNDLKCLAEIQPDTVAAAACELAERRLIRPLPAETAMLP